MSKKLSTEISSAFTVHSKYAKYIPQEERRETWDEIVERNIKMHIKKYPQLKDEIADIFNNFVKNKKVLMSMRSAQFAGKPIELSPSRIYNCCYLPIDHYKAFSEAMFLLLGGTGVGYSVQRHHVEKLPEIKKPIKTRKYVISDSIEGWADAVKILMKAYFQGRSKPRFIFDDIRPKGATLVTSGGKAPGPEPLKDCLHNLEKIFERKNDGDKLTTLECHDMICYIADAVLAGGIRRAALISGFDIDDEDMLTCKFGNWWELNPQRGRANNSAVVLRHKITKEKFFELWEKIKASGSGEPGFYLSNNQEFFTNPCCFTGDTFLKTNRGFQSLKDLNDQHKNDLKFYNVRNELVDGTVWSNGVKEIVELKLANGEKIRCTPDHRFMLNDKTECQAQDIRGKRLMPNLLINERVGEFTKLGFIQGDGGLSRLRSPSHKGLEVHIGNKDVDIAELFGVDFSFDKRTYYLNGFNEICEDLGFSSESLPERSLPSTYKNWNYNNKSDFLKGLYSANGCVIKHGRVSFKTTCLNLVEELQETLKEDFGIDSYVTTNKPNKVKFNNGSYICQESYDLNIGKFQDVMSFAKEIAFVHKYKNDDLSSIIKEKSPIVLSVKPAGKEEVFDFSLEDDTHWGVVSTGDQNHGYIAHNCEIALRPNQFCNLTEINMSNISSQEELNERAKAAAFIGTLQTGYTDFHYLRDIWKKTTERDALIGVSGTGIGSGTYKTLNLTEATEIVKKENERIAEIIGVKKAARTTCVKPAGTTSLVLGTSSGIHAWYAPYYIRRIRLGKNEAIYNYLNKIMPELLEDEYFNPTKQAVFSIPTKAPEGGIFRTESPIDLLERIKKFSLEWVKPGHRSGDNSHNVSATISIKDDEWNEVGEWMWKNREHYNGLSVLPFDGGSYKQAPFEEITKEEYEKLSKHLKKLDLIKVIEEEDNTDLKGEIACAGGVCDI